MLVRGMYYLTLNSEVIIGQIVVYLGEIVEKWEKGWKADGQNEL